VKKKPFCFLHFELILFNQRIARLFYLDPLKLAITISYRYVPIHSSPFPVELLSLVPLGGLSLLVSDCFV
jgi:hypothetical protein